MKRSSLFIFALASIGGLGLLAPVRAQETITYFDRTKKGPAIISGVIVEDTVAKVVCKSAVAGLKEIAPTDIIELVYTDLPTGMGLYNKVQFTEKSIDSPTAKPSDRVTTLNNTISQYKDLRGQLDAKKSAQRHIDWKIARLQYRLSQDDATQKDAAIDTLTKFKTSYTDGWQIFPAYKLLGNLLIEKEKPGDAQKVFEDLAKLPLGKELKQEADLLVAQAMTRGQKYKEAEEKLLAALQALPENDPQVAKVRIYLSECKAGTGKLDDAVRELETVITKTTDPSLRALAHNTLGDCFRANSKPRDALWQYLWVDIVYNQDRPEHVKAVTHLAKLFEELKDEEKAKQYKDKLTTLK